MAERNNNLKIKPILKARQTVVNSLDNTNDAWKYLQATKAEQYTKGCL